MTNRFSPGSLVRARGRDWIVLPDSEPSVVRLRRRCHEKWIRPPEDWKADLDSGRGGGLPRLERFFSEDAVRVAGGEMALDVEGVLDGGVNG
jgi:hypothetical protein